MKRFRESWRRFIRVVKEEICLIYGHKYEYRGGGLPYQESEKGYFANYRYKCKRCGHRKTEIRNQKYNTGV